MITITSIEYWSIMGALGLVAWAVISTRRKLGRKLDDLMRALTRREPPNEGGI